MKKLICSLTLLAMLFGAASCSKHESVVFPDNDKTNPGGGSGDNTGNDNPGDDDTVGKPATNRFLYYGDPAVAEAFYSQGDDTYTLSVDFDSPWGCLVRTSASNWNPGTKYGGAAGKNRLAWGEPMSLVSNANGDPSDILMPDTKVMMYHSHFWTDWFVDLDYKAASECENSPAFRAIVKSAEKWIDLGIDGLRLDGAKHIYHNADSDENHIFWGKMFNELNDYFQSKGHTEKFYMVGEVFDDTPKAAPYFKGLPSIFDFGFWYRLSYAVGNNTGRYFAKDVIGQFETYKSYRSDYIASTKLTNHDENRARSEFGGSLDKAKIAGAMLLTAGGHPYIYYGEELGYVGVKDGKGDEYVRNPMKWGDSYTTTRISQSDSGMTNVGDVKTQLADETSILNVYRTFSHLRNSYPALANGTMSKHAVYNEDNGTFPQIAAWYMSGNGQKLLVMHNVSSAAKSLPVSDNIIKVVATLGTASVAGSGSSTTVELGAFSSLVALVEGSAAAEEWDKVKRADVSYQLLVYSFADSNGDGTGDFRGIIDKLDYLDDLGVSALWLSPVHPAASYHGYDVKDYDAINPEYGTEEDFKQLIDEAHKHGIKIYMDWVINHTSKDHPWFKDVLADENSPYRDYYVMSESPAEDIAAGKIPMISTEGAAGYDSGQWFRANADWAASEGPVKVKFTLKWGSTPTLTVEKVDTVEN